MFFESLCNPSERSKILYAGSRLDGAAFNWFQPPNYVVSSRFRSCPFPGARVLQNIQGGAHHYSIYGDPNLEATAVRENRRLHQIGSAAEYTARFESKKQYIPWNDEAFRDQFYLNLKEDMKDEIAPVGRPKTYLS
jgi:hypothetical protein